LTSTLSRIFGALIIGAALFGLVLSAFGIQQVWRQKSSLGTSLVGDVGLFQENLEATSDGLVIVQDALDTTVDTLDTLQDALEALSKSVTETAPLLASLEALTGEDLPNTIAATQASLEVAQSSAAIIDNVLTLITSIPFFPGEPYAPAVPLSDALNEVSRSLDTLPESLFLMEEGLQDSRRNLIFINAQIQDLITTVDQIQETVESAAPVLETYQVTVQRLSDRTGQIETNLPGWLNSIAWAATAFLVWLGFTQIGLLVQGFEMFRARNEA
jgi:methyl-accepting chemotaxis protein